MKTWLQSNEIYFKTIASSLLSLMAIIIAITQWQIAQRQLEIKENEALGLFKVEQIQDTTFDFDTARIFRTMSIINEGKGIKNLSCNIESYFEITVNIRKKGIKFKTYIPLKNYYFLSKPTGNLTGRVFEATCSDLKTEQKRLARFRLDFYKKNNIYILNDIQKFITINYTDVNNKRHGLIINNEAAEISKKYSDSLRTESLRIHKNRFFETADISDTYLDSIIKINLRLTP